MTLNDLIGKITCADCLDILKQLPDKCVDLVLTDPPYGINIAEWDSKIPQKQIFDEIFRVSKKQIIFGGNYFNLPHSEGWLCWDKTYRFNRNIEIGEFELAWTSCEKKHKFIRYTYCGNFYGYKNNVKAHYDKEPIIHPTQKPIELFEIILSDYSNENDLVLDCFSGSGTTAVACHNLKRRFICIERDPEYCKASQERLEQAQRQQTLF
jgi:site-specific DNA-methyltransferase (adenine-specific)